MIVFEGRQEVVGKEKVEDLLWNSYTRALGPVHAGVCRVPVAIHVKSANPGGRAGKLWIVRNLRRENQPGWDFEGTFHFGL